MKNEYFAIGKGHDVWLVCEHRARRVGESRKEGTVYGRVLNGCWDFELYAGTLTILHTKKKQEASIIWSGSFPDRVGDYNDMAKYIERRLSHWWITNYLIEFGINAKKEWRRFGRACRAAMRNFKIVYRENSEFVQDERDTIPF